MRRWNEQKASAKKTCQDCYYCDGEFCDLSGDDVIKIDIDVSKDCNSFLDKKQIERLKQLDQSKMLWNHG